MATWPKSSEEFLTVQDKDLRKEGRVLSLGGREKLANFNWAGQLLREVQENPKPGDTGNGNSRSGSQKKYWVNGLFQRKSRGGFCFGFFGFGCRFFKLIDLHTFNRFFVGIVHDQPAAISVDFLSDCRNMT